MRPLHTLLSALVVAVALGVLVWAAETRAAVRRCRRSHPAACLAAVLAVGLLVLWAVGGAGTFLLSIAGPVLGESPLSSDGRGKGQRVRTEPGLPWFPAERGLGHPAGLATPPLQSAFPGFTPLFWECLAYYRLSRPHSVLSAFHQPRPPYCTRSSHGPVAKRITQPHFQD